MSLEDIPLYHAWRNDTSMMQSTSLSLDVYDIEETTQFVENIMLGQASAKTNIILCIPGNEPPSSIFTCVFFQ